MTETLPLLGQTRAKILHLLLTEGKTASQVAAHLHIQVSAARKHLERLAALGLATETFEKSGVGRPRKVYTLTTDGKEIFPRQYETLLNLALAKMVEKEGPTETELLMNDLAREVASAGDEEKAGSVERMRRAEEEVNRLGFEASFNRNDGSLTVVSRNCPLWKVALAQREIVCRGFHAELLNAYFDGKGVEREKWLVEGDTYCKHIIKGLRD